MGDLEDYVRDCKRCDAEPSQDSAFLHWLIDMEMERYGGRQSRGRPPAPAVAGPDPDRDEAEREQLWKIAPGGEQARRAELVRQLDDRLGSDV